MYLEEDSLETHFFVLFFFFFFQWFIILHSSHTNSIVHFSFVQTPSWS